MQRESVRTAQRAAMLSVLATTIVVIVKVLAAILSGSISVLAEALQSSVDILMAVITLVAIRYAALPPDPSHPYGHGKAEFLSSAFQMLIILGSGIFILWASVQRLMHPEQIKWGWGAVAMGYTIVSNTLVAIYLKRLGRKQQSQALLAEATHLRADTIASAGVLVGVLLVGLTGYAVLDPVVAILFTIATMAIALYQLKSILHPLMDGALPESEIVELKRVLLEHPEAKGFHNLRTRLVGAVRYVDLHVMLDDNLPFVRAHELAEELEDEMRAVLGGAVVTIHYEPYESEIAHRAREHVEE
ncbi:MAG: cation transporter [Fimbriimonadaceae bacterium]|nr:cation transporter [Fimbriimonadaceae bacterium]